MLLYSQVIKMEIKKVPRATLERYPIYLKALRKLQKDGITDVMSKQLSEYVNVASTTIRRDFSFLGSLGKQGFGYNVDALIETFHNVLGVNFDEKIIIVGVGNLGKALLNYNRWDYVVGEIVCGFDINVNQNVDVPVYHIDDLAEKLPKGCRIAILTVSSNVQETVDKLVKCGIVGIVDFTHQHIVVPAGISLRSVDVVSTIQEIVFETNKM